MPPMQKSQESAVFADLLSKTFTTDEERASHEREVPSWSPLPSC
jgi:hypothetical protein